MKKKIEWNEDWTLDLDGIDAQHKELIRLLNGMSDNAESYNDLIQDFIEYANHHFNDEEQLMQQSGYVREEYDKHKSEHKIFKKAVFEVSFKLIKIENNTVAIKEIMNKFKEFCFVWFDNHFLKSDKKFADFMNNGGDASY